MLVPILIALAIFVATGLIAGVLLAVISHFFGIEEDEKYKKVRGELPGINCGACGFRGCDDYAKALANGETSAGRCIPGAETVAEKLAHILGVAVEEPTDVVAFVRCNGNCEATSKLNTYDGVMTCSAAALTYGGPNSCLYGCLGFGDCANACPAHAICVDDGIAHVDTSKCLGCGLCVDTCPKHVILLVPQETATVVMCNNKDKGADARKACKNACIGCKKCEKSCPEGAITVQNNVATIDYSKCTGCQTCVSGCPTHCLHSVFFPDLPEVEDDGEDES